MPPKPGTYLPLNAPRPITVESARDRPVALVDRAGERTGVAAIDEMWKIDEEWWRDPVRRTYFRIRLADGRVRTIYLDQEADRWYEQAY